MSEKESRSVKQEQPVNTTGSKEPGQEQHTMVVEERWDRSHRARPRPLLLGFADGRSLDVTTRSPISHLLSLTP
ncbi:hypothetical protein FA13DRAFT_1725396 [Coprinellus micaceus]|uniref:Uncharacterized protein n=1 Tax=Coprinellus micaceus TaxID=71717 RepID=A0A4Y7TUA1_COPMI|nr:hypothetical protein FA13DRAFT_1725396 [Coprinellus micaceus]